MHFRFFPGRLIIVWGVVLSTAFNSVSAESEEEVEDKYPDFMNIPGFKTTFSKPSAAFDFPVDPSTYALGPGDVLGIDIFGEIYQQYILTVNPQGGIVFPEFGFLDAKGHSIESFEKSVFDSLKNVLQYEKIKIYLKRAKKIRVTVTGAVNMAGNYILEAPARLSDAIQAAGFQPWGRKDAVKIKQGEKEREVDQFQFFKTGDPLYNPVLAGGSIVHIPACQEDGAYIVLKTESLGTIVCLPKGAQISDLPILFPEGFINNMAQTFVTVIRSGEAKALHGLTAFPLQANDTVVVVQVDSKVYVSGLVAMPGPQHYSPSMTLDQYISMAGGPTYQGHLGKTEVYRNGQKIKTVFHEPLQPGDVVRVPGRGVLYASEIVTLVVGISSLIISAATVYLLGTR